MSFSAAVSSVSSWPPSDALTKTKSVGEKMAHDDAPLNQTPSPFLSPEEHQEKYSLLYQGGVSWLGWVVTSLANKSSIKIDI
jgi:hypothetical protein